MKDRNIVTTKVTDNIFMVQLEANQTPKFSIDRFKGIVKYGEKNDFPEQLIYLFQNNPIHQAIVSTKANYLGGLNLKAINNPKADQWLLNANPFESWYSVSKKNLLDKPLFG